MPDYCYIQPMLNTIDLSFNNIDGSFKGKIYNNFENNTYTINCVNGVGNSSVDIRFSYINIPVEDECLLQGNSFLRIILYTHYFPYIIKFSVNNPDGSTLLSLSGEDEEWGENTQYEYTKCVKQGIYTLTRESSSGDWDFQSIAIQLYSTTIGNYSINDVDPEIISNKLYCIL